MSLDLNVRRLRNGAEILTLDMTRLTLSLHPGRARHFSLEIKQSIVHQFIAHGVRELCSPASIRSSTSNVEGLRRALRAERYPNVPGRSIYAYTHSAVYATRWM
jgi:hypothetical protein